MNNEIRTIHDGYNVPDPDVWIKSVPDVWIKSGKITLDDFGNCINRVKLEFDNFAVDLLQLQGTNL